MPQIIWSAPAFATVGALFIVTNMVSVFAAHTLLPVVVNINLIFPAAVSAALGV